MTITLDTSVSVPEDVLMQVVDGEAVILDLSSAEYFGLNDVGTRMIELLRDHGTVREAHAALIGEYEVEPDRLEQDLIGLVTQLVDAGLVKLT